MRTLGGALMWSLVPPPQAALRSSHTRSADEHDKGIKNVFPPFFFSSPALGGGILFSFFSPLLSSLAHRSHVITDIFGPFQLSWLPNPVPVRGVALSSLPFQNTIGGSFRCRRYRRHRGKHSAVANSRLADVLITFVLVPKCLQKTVCV